MKVFRNLCLAGAAGLLLIVVQGGGPVVCAQAGPAMKLPEVLSAYLATLCNACCRPTPSIQLAHKERNQSHVF